MLLLSARSEAALESATTNLAEYLGQQGELKLADVAYTLQLGRHAFGRRRMVVCRTLEEAAEALSAREPSRVSTNERERGERPIVFLFPGQGAQYLGMGAELYRHEPTFRAALDRCCELLLPQLGLDLRELLFDERRRTNDEGPTTTDQRPPTKDRDN